MTEVPQAALRDALAIVIVNWNTGKLLTECIASLPGASGPERIVREIVVVDNGSCDASLDGLEQLPLGDISLHIERLEHNIGFGAACNLGAAKTSAPLILFLNPDTVLEPASLRRPVGYMVEIESTRVEVASILSVDEAGRHTASCARFPTLLQHLAAAVGADSLLVRWKRSHMMLEFDHRSDRDVEQVIGAFFLVRRSAFERLGGFDERFFVYYEEVDFCVRIWNSGGRVRHLADARYMHVGCGSSRNDPVARLAYSLTSRALFHRKHGGLATYLGVLAISFVIELPARIFAGFLGRQGLGMRGVLAAYRQFSSSLLKRRWFNGRSFDA